jgi:hypothetical protein
MLDQIYLAEQVWNTMQEPRCPIYMPTGYMLLLSALDNGWQIVQHELAPSWDQNEFIYLITLRHQSGNYTQMIVPRNSAAIENLIQEYALPVAC